MAVRSQQQDIEAKRLGRLIGVGGRLREELASSGHDGRSGFGVTELIDVGVKKDLVPMQLWQISTILSGN